MHKSPRTRLFLSAYRAASALAHRLHQFASSLQATAAFSETRDYEVYLGKLHEEHTLLAEQTAAAELHLDALEEERARVREILSYTPRPQVPPFNEVQHITPADLTDLPQVDEEEAPWGYKAVLSAPERGCGGCAFDPTGECPHSLGDVGCTAMSREDGCSVVFVKR